MPLPIKLWGRLPKKGHIKMQSVHPIFKYRELSKRPGLMRAARREQSSTNVLTFPLRTAIFEVYSSCEWRPSLQCHSIWCGVSCAMRIDCSNSHSSGLQAYAYAHSPWRHKGLSEQTHSTHVPANSHPQVSFSSSPHNLLDFSEFATRPLSTLNCMFPKIFSTLPYPAQPLLKTRSHVVQVSLDI